MPSGTGARRRARAANRPATRCCDGLARVRRDCDRVSMAPSEAGSTDELAELVGDGIYVTRLHYLGVVDPRRPSPA